MYKLYSLLLTFCTGAVPPTVDDVYILHSQPRATANSFRQPLAILPGLVLLTESFPGGGVLPAVDLLCRLCYCVGHTLVDQTTRLYPAYWSFSRCRVSGGFAHKRAREHSPLSSSVRRCSPSSSRRRVVCFLWLLLFPCQGVQIWQQGSLQGQPVFTTSSVQPAASVLDLQSVRTPNVPLIEPVLRRGPQALRTIGVFRPQESEQPTVLISDDRVHGLLLHKMVCSAYGLAESEWQLRRLVEALPSLPTEQYILSPSHIPWDQALVPVDLRPLGGRVRLLTAHRCESCGDIAERAIQAQQLGACPVTLCRTSQGWFHPTARLLLLPYGDAFQVWPMHRVPSASLTPNVEEDDAPATLEDRFSTSLSLPAVGELAFHDLSGANAVILHAHGHTYACVPSYSDHLTLRSSALSAVAVDLQIQPRGRLCCARILPPLDRMPAIQFVAAYCEDGQVLGVVDLRPSGGGVYVTQVREGATPAERIAATVQRHGEPSSEMSLASGLAQGRLQVLHREHVVDPFAPLHAAPPAPVVVLSRRSHLASGYRDPQLPSDEPDILEDATLGIAPDRATDASATTRFSGGTSWGSLLSLLLFAPRWLSLLTVPYVVSCMYEPPDGGEFFQPLGGSPWHTATQHPGLASVEEHATLGRSLPSMDSRPSLSLSVDDNVGVPEFRFCVWSPGEGTCFFLPGRSAPITLRERLLEAKVRLGRGDCTVWDPSPADRGLHYVATAEDTAIVTVIADTGREYLCLDVPRIRFGSGLLSAVQLLCPDRCFRIADSIRTPVRHGDVIRLFDEPMENCRSPQFYVPRFTYPPSMEPGTQLVYIASVDMGMIRLKVPVGVETHTLEQALVVWLGRQRCLGVRLHKLDVDAAVPVYCLPRRGRSTLAIGLLDLADPIMDTIVHVVDTEESADLDCAILREPWRAASLFWNDVLARGPVCVACWHSRPTDSAGGPRFRMVALGLDVCRALGTGWRPPVPSVVPDYDLVIAAEHLGINWGSNLLFTSRDASTQTSATHWPMRASPLFSSAMPVPRKAEGCSFDEKFGAEGTLFHLDCPHMHVRCTIPCVAGRHIWAVRLGNWVRAACTTRLSWDEVLEVAGLSYWDLPGTSIHGPDQVWTWPEDVVSLSGQCGHVMHSGTDPHLDCLYAVDSRPPPTDAARSPSPRYTPSWWHIPLFVLASRGYAASGGIVVVLAFTTAQATSDTDASDVPSALHSSNASAGLIAAVNATPDCSSAWCYELSCQSTHFTVDSVSLAEYFTTHSPFELVRVQLWNPFEGPSLFDFLRSDPATALHSKLLAAGHDPLKRVLYVAFDTQSTVVDLISVPPNSGRWWIIRDGLSRELLRPVTTWVDENRRSVVTLNSHGQAASIATTPETAALYHLPQGARGATAASFSRVYGHLTTTGLVLVEASIGVVSGVKLPRSLLALWLLLFAVPSQAMMQGQVVPASSQALWSSSQPPPQHTRVWTHTLAAPVTVTYSPEPNPARLAAAVAATQRGPRGDGVFDWTLPRQYGDTAHIIHYPAGLCPPFVFWLLHYRGRGTVICATPGHVDWQHLAQEASEAFSSPGFMQGSFGIQHNGRIFAYGSDLVTPPHGTILHLVRMGARASSSSAGNVWEAPAELHWIPQFEYNLCLGPGGEAPLCDSLPGRRASPGSGDELQASLSYMQHLLGRLEQSVEQCHAAAVALATVHSTAETAQDTTSQSAANTVPEAANGVTGHVSATLPSCRANWIVRVCLGLMVGSSKPNSAGFWVYSTVSLLAPIVYADDDSGEEEQAGPTEPSSPDLLDLQAPTPTGSIEFGSEPAVGIIQRPSDSPFARTSAPLRGDIEPSLTPFDLATIPSIQRTVAACLSDVDIAPSAEPLIPAGCPFTIHNPFTSRSQCKVMSEVISSPQRLRTVLSDFSARRGWQPLVSLHPQPDAHSVHLLPAAADPSLASVVLRTGTNLQALCLSRTWQGNPYRRIALQGRQGRLREPYSVSRGSGGSVTFRDGDCLHADMGPFGPPPPTPATSGLGPRSALLWTAFALALLHGDSASPWSLWLLLVCTRAVQIVPPAPEGVSVTRVSVSHYPWRETLERQTLRQVFREKCCRVSLLCPWRGPQGLYHTPLQATLQEVWAHYAEDGRPHELVPIWPGLSADRLWFVPRAHIAGSLVCVVAVQGANMRALVLPARMSFLRLSETVRYLTGWDIAALRPPLCLQVRHLPPPDVPCILRDGDVLDAMPPGAERSGHVVRSPADLKCHVLWTRDLSLQQPTFIRIWSPRIRPPILLCIAARERWDSVAMSFSGHFQTNHPGRWVPVPWAPCRLPHFVQVSDDVDCANVLFEEPSGVHCVTFDRQVTPHDIMHGTSEHCRGVRVLGSPHIGRCCDRAFAKCGRLGLAGPPQFGCVGICQLAWPCHWLRLPPAVGMVVLSKRWSCRCSRCRLSFVSLYARQVAVSDQRSHLTLS